MEKLISNIHEHKDNGFDENIDVNQIIIESDDEGRTVKVKSSGHIAYIAAIGAVAVAVITAITKIDNNDDKPDAA
ncbi:hypothetical protein ACFL5P_00535 [candidate division KSB1 bacterium]